MAVPDHSIDPKILQSAKLEFLKNGYEKTKLNTICEKVLRCAQGTVYSNFQHDWVEKMTESTGVFLWQLQRRELVRKDISQKEIHVVLSAFWTTIFEPFVHEFSWKEIECHVDFMCGLFNWHKMFELKK